MSAFPAAAPISAFAGTPAPASRLSVSKRKRDDADAPATPSTGGALMQTPRLRSLPSALMTPSHASTNGLLPAAPSTPLLSMPTPSSELLPVLSARAARAGEAVSTSGSSGLLRSSSAVTQAANTGAAAASAYAANVRALEAAALERERALRLSVEELRASLRAKTTDLAEAALKAEQREATILQERHAHAERIEKMQAQLRFIHQEEQKENSKLQECEHELTQAQQTQQQQRIELTKLKQQLVFASSPGQHKPLRPRASHSADDEEVNGQVAHLENVVALQARQITVLESQMETLRAESRDADDERRESDETRARLVHAESLLETARWEARANASLTATAEVTGRRAGEILAVQQKCEALQAENSRLREQKHNAALAAEQLLSAQAKLHRLEAERDAAAKVELENEKLKARLTMWEEAVRALGVEEEATSSNNNNADDDSKDGDVEMSDSTSPAGDSPSAKRQRRRRQSTGMLTPEPFIASYRRLQARELSLQSTLNEVELNRKMAERARTDVEKLNAENEQKVLALVDQLSKAKADLVTCQRQNTVLVKSRDGLQKVLDAYDNEQAPLLKPGAEAPAAMQIDSGDAGDSEATEAHKALRTRISYLETIVREFESQVASLSRESGRPLSSNPHAASPIEPIPSVLSLLSRIVHLEKESSHLESLLADLTEKVEWVNGHYPHLLDKEHGSFKIVKLANNPSYVKVQSKQQAELEASQKENQILKLRCEELQAAAGSSSSTSSGAADGASASSLLALETSYQSRLTALETEKSQLEKKTQRLKELFGQKVLEFRNTCFLLTGYKIELVQGSSYRLKNMYAEKEDDQLMFQQQPSTTSASGAVQPGGLAVLETDFTKSLDGTITNYLEKFESIPGFLSAVTLHLLEKQTKIR